MSSMFNSNFNTVFYHGVKNSNDSVVMDYISLFNRMVNGCGKVGD
jgi:hypothetical protein